MLRPPLVFLLTASLLTGGGLLRAELTTEQKKELFRKSHSGTAQGSSSAKKKSSPSSSGSAGTKKKSAAPKKSSSGSSKSGKRSSHGKSSPSGSAKNSPKSSSLAPSPKAEPPPPVPVLPAAATAAAASATALPLPHGAEPSAPITIEKSGVEADQGFEPAPTPEPARGGFWSRLFGSSRTYNYLSSPVRSAIDRAPVKRGRWKYIVVHNSGTREGNARVFDIYHRRVRHMQNGLAYHFVIGDGHGSGDGQVEVGDRWRRQINGGHVASDYLNDIALGICLVGDFNRDQPTKAQVGALEELVSYLRNRVGRSQGRQAIVHAHREINPRPTDCPGTRFPYGWLHAKFGNGR